MRLKSFFSISSVGFVFLSALALTGCAKQNDDAPGKNAAQNLDSSQAQTDSTAAPAANKVGPADSGDNAASTPVQSFSLVGKWEGQTEIYEFYADGTGAVTFKPHVPKDDLGKITWSGNTVQIGPIRGNATYSADGKTLTLTDPKTGYSSKFKKL